MRKWALMMATAVAVISAVLVTNDDSPDVLINLRFPVTGPASKYLEAIEVLNEDGSPCDSETTVENLPERITIQMGLGESFSKLIRLYPRQRSAPNFRIEQQYETSLTVMREGPHLDLTDWKHFISEWSDLKTGPNNSFLTSDVSGEEFPSVTNQEIVDAVVAELKNLSVEDDSWVNLARQCQTPTTYPCGVSVSKIRLRLSVQQGRKWLPIHVIELIPPMGC